MSDDITSDDIHQLVQQGDLRTYMRSLIQRPEGRRDFPDAVAPQSREDGWPVGTWPSGAHKPGCAVFGIPDGQQCGCLST